MLKSSRRMQNTYDKLSIFFLNIFFQGILHIPPMIRSTMIFGDRYHWSLNPICVFPIPNIFRTYSIPMLVVLHLKNTHPIITISIVYRWRNTEGSDKCTCFFSIRSDTINKPFHIPQITKCQLLPCHSPVARKTIERFRYTFPRRFPPRGI